MKQNSRNQKLIFISIGLIIATILGYLIFSGTKKSPQLVPAAPKHLTLQKPTSKIPVYPEEITGNIITLKKLTAASAFDYYKMFSPNVRKYIEFPEKITFGYIAQYLHLQEEKIKRGLMIAYNIWDNKDNQMVGSIQIREKNVNDVGQLGMWINDAYRGGGRIQEALYLISQAYFKARPETPNYVAHVRPWNTASIKAMEKFGFKKVGDYIEDGKVTRYIFELTKEALEQKNSLIRS